MLIVDVRASLCWIGMFIFGSLVVAKDRESYSGSGPIKEDRLDSINTTELIDRMRTAWTEHPESGVRYAEIVLARAQDSVDWAKGILNLGVAYQYAGHQAVGLKYCLEAVDFFERHDHKNDLASAYNNAALAYEDLSSYPKALEYYLESLKIKENQADTIRVVGTLNNIGAMYDNQDDFENALSYYNKALTLTMAIGHDAYEAMLHTNIGITYTVSGEYEAALSEFKVALDLYQQLGGNTYSLVLIYSQSGVANDGLGYYVLADSLHDLADQLALQVGTADLKQETLYNRGIGLIQRKSFDKAEVVLLEGMEVGKAHNDVSYLRVYYDALADLYEAKKNYPEALAFEKRIRQYEDSVRSVDNRRYMSELQTLYETDKKELALLDQRRLNEIQKAKISRQEERSMLLMIIVIMSIAFAIWLFLTYRKQVAVNQELQIQKVEIERLAKTEAKLSAELLGQKNRELVTYSMQMQRHYELLDDIKDKLRRLDRSECGQLTKIIDASRLAHSQWDELKAHFEQVHPDFFTNLEKLFPRLTQHDLRLCAFIKMHMESRAITHLLNISAKGLETARYRLKGKLGLNREDDLNHFITTLDVAII